MANSAKTPRNNDHQHRQPPIRAQEAGANQAGGNAQPGPQGRNADYSNQQGNLQGRNLPEGNQQGGYQQDRQQQPQQQQQSATAEKYKGKWQQQVGSAKVLWGKLTDDEILQTEGKLDKLSGLVKERYAISQEAAEDQVKKFLSDTGY